MTLLTLLYGLNFYAQTNAITINAELDAKNDVLKIQQEIIYYNKTQEQLKEIYLHNWPNSFKDKNTPLTKRLIEDYNKSLYFAKENERGFSTILNLTVNYKTIQFSSKKSHEDILKIPLAKGLNPNDSVKINLTYAVKIPDAKFTNYGKTNTGYHLRFWYLIPAVYTNDWQLTSNLNIDDMFMDVANYNISFQVPQSFFVASNLTTSKKDKSLYKLTGKNRKDIIISIQKNNNFKKYTTDNNTIISDIPIKDISNALIADVLNRELKFIEQYLGKYPHKEILLDELTQKKNPIYGLNQLPSFLNPFTNIFEIDITFFKALTKTFIDNTLIINKRKDYWLTDGIETFLLMEYVKKHYPDVALLGAVSDFWFTKRYNFSKLRFNDKYPLIYQFSARRFLDQALTTRLDSLSNFNRKIGNKYKAGLGLQYLKGFVGDTVIKESFKAFYNKHLLKISSSNDFKKILSTKTNKDITWFFGDYISTNKKIDYTIKKVATSTDSITVTIKNKRNITAPVALYGVKNKAIKFKKWISQVDSAKTIHIPKGDFDKISLNYEQIYPEYNSLDNWKNIKPSLLNKPVQFRLIKDISDPYYNQLFYQPEFGYNYYDGVTLGLKLHNKPIIPRNFIFKIVPTYATKSKSLTGSATIMYNQFFEKTKLQRITYGIIGSNFHYAQDLSYKIFAPFITTQFKRKSLRDASSKFFTVKYVKVDKEHAPNTTTKEQDNYNVLNLKYVYANPNIIEGIMYKFNTDISSNFSKVAADIRYRKLTDKNRQLDFRFFAGAFLHNKTISNYFSFGLDRPSDYLFEQMYFGRSESSGIFSQQIIINDGGFKSVLPTRFANQYMVSLNSSIGLWRWLEYYTDVAFLKNKGQNTYFAYENGIRFNFIHNILEFYFPMYSNNGWEINQQAYASKIRFVLTVRPSAIYNFFRRGFL
ncbi:MAG: aminopeptidase [Flavobacteriaceae bacterium]|nr:aminopeptidase [Flavobacteriaceae bacterium]